MGDLTTNVLTAMEPTSVPMVDSNANNDQTRHSSSELRPITKQRQTIVLISSFLTICITIGFNQSYGVFQSYYTSSTQTMLPPSTKSESALVAFVGTLGYGLTWVGSIFVNPIMARLGLRGTRTLCVIGVFTMSLGFGLASLSTQVCPLWIPKFVYVRGYKANQSGLRFGIFYLLRVSYLELGLRSSTSLS